MTEFALSLRGLRPDICNNMWSQHRGKTVRDFVFEGITRKLEEWDIDYRIDMVVAPLLLDPDDTLDMLSGGQLRRAALARSLVEQPDILLLDEPTNHMDLELIEWLEEYIKGYKRGGNDCLARPAVSRQYHRPDILD